ncbi:MAG: hypothetical protein IPH62_14815 [Ignavibacteriae bacterium]|nr:hypothetical protein [Ignavibacteriota bacterium]
MKKILKIISPVLIIAGLYFIFKTNEIKQPPGILAPNPPYQEILPKQKIWLHNEYTITAIAKFESTCKALHLKTYSNDKMSNFAPLDIAVGWGKMSDQTIVDKFEIKQQHRWYVWRTKQFPIPRKEVELNGSNIHIIPANEEVENQLDEIKNGNIISLKGYLVNVKDKDSKFIWKTSLKRDDNGSGACEILWLEEAEVIK